MLEDVPDIQKLVNKLERSITKWTKACDKRLNRLISYIHHTCEYRQYCYVGNTAKQCRLGLFQDSDFAGDLEDSQSTSGGTLCVFGSHTFVPISWMCKKQTSVSHSSTEAEIISLDAGLRMDGIPALTLSIFWELVIEVFHSSPNQTNKTKDVREPQGNLSANTQPNMQKQIPTTHTNLDLTNIDHVASSGTRSGSNAMLYVCEYNEAVMKMTIKGRSPTMRHVSRSPKKIAKRMQEQKGEQRIVAKSKSTATNLSSHVPASSSSAKSPIAFKSPGILIATVKLESRIRRNSKFDSTSSSQVRLQDAYLGGLMDKATVKLVATKEESGTVDLS